MQGLGVAFDWALLPSVLRIWVRLIFLSHRQCARVVYHSASLTQLDQPANAYPMNVYVSSTVAVTNSGLDPLGIFANVPTLIPKPTGNPLRYNDKKT